ncbi:MAG: tetratricopeptide repeat protein [Treponema sp.]|nr:tetratricopeptide repeat protein [Treponema sp.]
MNSTGQNESVVNAFINMGNIYAGTKQGTVATEYLNKASSRATDPLLKAEILYRMGKESYYLKDFHSATRSLQYAIKLNPSHNKARFILQQLQEEENRK